MHHPSASQIPRTFPAATLEDRWFNALDQQVVFEGGIPRCLTVIGIHRGQRGDLWLQLAVWNDHGLRRFVVGCRDNDSLDDVLHTIQNRLTPDEIAPLNAAETTTASVEDESAR
jgi:hypothetical protein